MLLLTLHLLTAVPAAQLPAAMPPSVHLLDRGLMLAQAPELNPPPGVARDPFAGAFSPMEALVAGLAVFGVDSVVSLVALGVFFAIAPTLVSESGLLVLTLLAAGTVVLDALIAPLVAALVVTSMAGPGPQGGFGGALTAASLASGLALLVSLATAFTPLLAAVNPILSIAAVALGTVGATIHLVGIPIAASFGLHRVTRSGDAAAPTALAYSGPAAAAAGPMPALVLARF